MTFYKNYIIFFYITLHKIIIKKIMKISIIYISLYFLDKVKAIKIAFKFHIITIKRKKSLIVIKKFTIFCNRI
jgi:hypothetical protein